MSIIEHLDTTVTTTVLTQVSSEIDPVAAASLLEHFYAIMATRLARATIYSAFQRSLPTDSTSIAEPVAPALAPEAAMRAPATGQTSTTQRDTSVLARLWQDQHSRQALIEALANEHHINQTVTSQLLSTAAPLAYHELTACANGQFLPAFLQDQRDQWRPFLPVWSGSLIDAPLGDTTSVEAPRYSQQIDDTADHAPAVSNQAMRSSVPASSMHQPSMGPSPHATVLVAESAAAADSTTHGPQTISPEASVEDTEAAYSAASAHSTHSAIHANPSEHRDLDAHALTSTLSKQDTSHALRRSSDSKSSHNGLYPNTDSPVPIGRTSRSGRQQGVRRLSWLLFALALLAGIGLVWTWQHQAKQAATEETIATPSTVSTDAVSPATPEPVTAITDMMLTSMTMGVDDAGQLYACSAEVGDVAMQQDLLQLFGATFGEQAQICDLTVVQDSAVGEVAMVTMSKQQLSEAMMLLRTVPFARLQLEVGRLTLEAPDAQRREQLLNDMRLIVPNLAIDSIASVPLPPSGEAPSSALNGTDLDGADFGDNDPMYTGQRDTASASNSPGSSGIDTAPYQNNAYTYGGYANNDPGNDRRRNEQSNSTRTEEDIFSSSGRVARSREAPPSAAAPLSEPYASAPSGPISLSEADEMARTEFIADPVTVN